jgi:amidase
MGGESSTELMTKTPIHWMSAMELRRALSANELSVSEIAEAMIERIEEVNPLINALVAFDPSQIREDARRLDGKKSRGEVMGEMFGIPFTIKSLTQMKGYSAAAGILPFADRIGTRDAGIVTRMMNADGLFLGRTNVPEAGYYGGTDNHLWGRTNNPWSLDHTPGGSSGGAAAAVAAGIGPIAEGGDGAGSVRIPASLCGVVGLKPSLGRIPHSMTGDARFYSFVFHGPIARTVADAALMLKVVSGESEEDPFSLPGTIDFIAELERPIEGWTIAYSEDAGTGVYVDEEVRSICRTALKAFEEVGAKVVDASPQWGDPELAMWHSTWVSSYARDYDELDWEAQRGKVDDNLIELMSESTRVTAADLGKAESFRGQMWTTYVEFMKDFELLVTPTLASASFPSDQFSPAWLDGEPLRTRILGWLLTYPFNMLTVPAITVPAGFTSDGRPVGLQIAGHLHREVDVLAAAARFEEVRPWSGARPGLSRKG